MKSLTQDDYQAFTARMREAAAYIAKCVTGKMQPVTRNTLREPKQDRPVREEQK